MAVFRIEKTVNYTVMSNYHLRDKELSCKACGLLSKMLSLPEEWDYTSKGLAYICKDGIDSVSSALKELEERGYLVRRRLRKENGQLGDIEYTIYEQPQGENPSVVEQEAQEINLDFPVLENPVLEEERQEECGFCPGDGSGDTRKTPVQGNPVRVEEQGEKPVLENPVQANPVLGKPVLENPAQLNTNQENKEEIKTDPSIYPGGEMDGDELWKLYRERIRENIEYEHLAGMYGTERVDGIVELMLDTILANSPSIRIGGAEYPRGMVRNRLLKLDSTHLEYVFDCMDKQESKVRNIKGYLLAALFNAPSTMDSYYRAEVQHDFGASVWKERGR